MKSSKSKRAEIKARRLERAKSTEDQLAAALDSPARNEIMERMIRQGLGIVQSDVAMLQRHNRSNPEFLPAFYKDIAFVCTNCGAHQLWTAKQQKWWYEVAGGPIYSGAKECRACRLVRRQVKSKSLLHVMTGRLYELGRSAPNAEARTEIEVALTSKWRGIRVTAIGVIGSWWRQCREHQDLDRLKSWVEADTHIFGEWPSQAASAARKAIAANMRESDGGWALNWLLQHSTDADILSLVRAVPQSLLASALSSMEMRRTLHEDEAMASRLLKLLLASYDQSPEWDELARHLAASPMISARSRQHLQGRLHRRTI